METVITEPEIRVVKPPAALLEPTPLPELDSPDAEVFVRWVESLKSAVLACNVDKKKALEAMDAIERALMKP